jgi:PQQ enzyme repeat
VLEGKAASHRGLMRPLISSLSPIVILLWTALFPANAQQVNVTQKNNNPSRDGLYIDAAFTPANAANLIRDLNFDGTIVGNVHAQPLYIEGGPNGPMVIVVTASNNVYALDATDGSIIWQRNVGTPVTSGLCGFPVNPFGIIGTPVVDLDSRSLFLNAMIEGATKKHFVFSLNVDTGATNPNWPVDLNATASYQGIPFTSNVENERGALAVVNGRVYVPFSGHLGDCGTYHGWVVGIAINNPSDVMAWATTAIGGGIWGHSGVASDGTNMFVITGNTFNAATWMGGEAIIRLQAGPVFSGQPTDYWAPTNWQQLDGGDTDLGGCSAILIDVPGATPSQLVLATGKDGNAYLVNRNNLGGISSPVRQLSVDGVIGGQSSATYTTGQGTYFVFRAAGNLVKAYKITAESPPNIVLAWSVSQSGQGSPWVTTTDGTNNAIVWVVGAQGDGRLHGYNGDPPGTEIYTSDQMTGTRKWNSGMVARGSIYVANDNKVYKFSVPGGTPTPTPTATPPVTPTPIPTATPPVTPTPSAPPTATPTSSATPSATPTATASTTPTATPRVTPRPRPTPHPRP